MYETGREGDMKCAAARVFSAAGDLYGRMRHVAPTCEQQEGERRGERRRGEREVGREEPSIFSRLYDGRVESHNREEWSGEGRARCTLRSKSMTAFADRARLRKECGAVDRRHLMLHHAAKEKKKEKEEN